MARDEHDGVAFCEKPLGQMVANKPGPARDRDFHEARSLALRL